MPVLIEEIPSSNENANDETKQLQEEMPELEKNNFNIEPMPFEEKTNRIELNETKVENSCESKLNEIEENKGGIINDSVLTPTIKQQSALSPSVR
jgi:hypothetical protein